MFSKTVTKDTSIAEIDSIINELTQDGYEVIKIKDVNDYKIIYYEGFK